MSQKHTVNMRLAALMIGIDRVVAGDAVARSLRLIAWSVQFQRATRATPH